MRQPLIPVLLALPVLWSGLAAATAPADSDAGQLSISRWGNPLLVTAPGGSQGDARLTARLTQKVTVDFKNMPQGARVTANKSAPNIDLRMGYNGILAR